MRHGEKRYQNTSLSNRTRNYIYKFLKTIMNFGTKWYGINFNEIYPKMTNFTNPSEIKRKWNFGLMKNLQNLYQQKKI